MGMPYDPKLKEAAAEIKAILNKHDIAGYISLMSESHSEFLMEIDPPWSCVQWEDKSNGKLRIKASKEMYGDKQDHVISSTAHMIFQMRDLCAQGFSFSEALTKKLEENLEIEHKPFANFTPHREN